MVSITCDNCRWFDKNGFAPGFGECVLRRKVQGSGHVACYYYKEYNGKWGKWVVSEVRCPECLEYFDTDTFSKEEMNNCPNCGEKMRGD